jgi:dipeptidyl aminopeptidase/acylaminoacyl peptidase
MQEDVVSRRRRAKIRFEHEDSDYYFMMALAYQGERGAEFGECFQIASHIKEGDAQSWVTAWSDYAKRLATEAGGCLAADHPVSARELYLRASTYYRMATIFVRVTDPRYRAFWERHRNCFQQAARALPRPVEPITVRFEETVQLPGYFMPGGDSASRRPTLIVTSGGEAFAEDAYFWCGAAGMRRGYNVIAVELPVHMGARLLNPALTAANRGAETVTRSLTAIIDAALSRTDVDPTRLSILGYSAGSAFAMRSAIHDRRLKACIADSPIYDMEKLFSEEFPRFFLNAPAIVGNFFARVATRNNELAAILFERTCWQVGAASLSEFVRRSGELRVKPEEITCPMLCLASEGEGKGFVEQTVEVYERLRGPKRIHIFTAEEGADAHCQLNNFTRAQTAIFDWLDEALA